LSINYLKIPLSLSLFQRERMIVYAFLFFKILIIIPPL